MFFKRPTKSNVNLGGDLDQQLKSAVKNNNTRDAEKLIQAGANPNYVDPNDHNETTILHLVRLFCRVEHYVQLRFFIR